MFFFFGIITNQHLHHACPCPCIHCFCADLPIFQHPEKSAEVEPYGLTGIFRNRMKNETDASARHHLSTTSFISITIALINMLISRAGQDSLHGFMRSQLVERNLCMRTCHLSNIFFN